MYSLSANIFVHLLIKEIRFLLIIRMKQHVVYLKLPNLRLDSVLLNGALLMDLLFSTGWGIPGADAPCGVCGRGDPGPR